MHEAEEIEHLIKLIVDLSILVKHHILIILLRLHDRRLLRLPTQRSGNSLRTPSQQPINILGNHLARLRIVRAPACICLLRLVHERLERFSQSVAQRVIAMERDLPVRVELALQREQVHNHILLLFLIEHYGCSLVIDPLLEAWA